MRNGTLRVGMRGENRPVRTEKRRTKRGGTALNTSERVCSSALFCLSEEEKGGGEKLNNQKRTRKKKQQNAE